MFHILLMTSLVLVVLVGFNELFDHMLSRRLRAQLNSIFPRL